MFTASSVPTYAHDSTTISPMDIRSDADHTLPNTDCELSIQSQYAGPLGFTTFDNNVYHPPSKCRCDSLLSLQSDSTTRSPASTQPQAGRRRGSEYAEFGSARAVYLEKNRKAASKCRSKQKRQQEQLVETAREMERRNKSLKAEAEMLRSDMQGLMHIVGQHTCCPDNRLNLYLQREADRLTIGGQQNSCFASIQHPRLWRCLD